MIGLWRGPFGDDYTDRQETGHTRDTLRRLAAPILHDLRSVLEVGCNRGDNLEAWLPEAEAVGVEPNAHARRLALDKGFIVEDATADNLPFEDGEFDLVYTCGVLIHIQPEKLDLSLAEIHRVARKYILAVEYHADTPTPIEYRGVKDGIWKRNYAAEYLDRFPLDLLYHGGEDSLADGPFEGCQWWLSRKS